MLAELVWLNIAISNKLIKISIILTNKYKIKDRNIRHQFNKIIKTKKSIIIILLNQKLAFLKRKKIIWSIVKHHIMIKNSKISPVLPKNNKIKQKIKDYHMLND